MARLTFGLIALMLATTSGCGGSSGSSASTEETTTASSSVEALFADMTRWRFRNQVGRRWAHLHPTYRASTTRGIYEKCQDQNFDNYRQNAASLVSVDYTDSYPDRRKFPLLGEIDVTAATVEYTYRWDNKTQKGAETRYFKKVGSEWYYLWNYAQYETRNTC